MFGKFPSSTHGNSHFLITHPNTHPYQYHTSRLERHRIKNPLSRRPYKFSANIEKRPDNGEHSISRLHTNKRFFRQRTGKSPPSFATRPPTLGGGTPASVGRRTPCEQRRDCPRPPWSATVSPASRTLKRGRWVAFPGHPLRNVRINIYISAIFMRGTDDRLTTPRCGAKVWGWVGGI